MFWQISMAMVLTLILFCQGGCTPTQPAAELVVSDQVLHEIDVRLFGQFLERASFGEPGPEAFADPQTGKLPDEILAMLKAMEIPIIRFPGGTDIDYIDWRDMIDNVPDREGGRPITQSYRPKREKPTTITNRFGYDEYFDLRDQLGCETIIVVNLLDAMARRRPVEEAALTAAGLVAYVNAPVGADLPQAMPDWPAIRAKNGHPQPFNAEYVQIGNEAFVKGFKSAVLEATNLENEALAAWYTQVYTAYIKAIRAVDPDVKIIIDAWLGHGPLVSDLVLADPYIKENVAYLARHQYAPGGCRTVNQGKEKIDPESLTEQQLWWAWVSMPGAVDQGGQNQAYGETLNQMKEKGYLVASTEWNWNGWSWQELTESFEAPSAAGIGAAAFIHGLMRHGDQIKIANQSMLVGSGWGIAAIFGDPDGQYPPYYNPQGSSTTFYRKNHGRNMLQSKLSGVATHRQPYSFGWGGGVDKPVAELDVIVTADDGKVFVHAIIRTFDKPLPLNIDLTALKPIGETAIHHQLTFKPFGEPGRGHGRGMATESAQNIPASSKMTVTLPPRTLSILEIPR